MPTKISETNQLALQEFEQILRRATEKKASDLHLKAGLPPIVRVNGNLYYLGDDAGENISRLTQPSAQRISSTRLMNTRTAEKYENGEEVDLGYEIKDAVAFVSIFASSAPIRAWFVGIFPMCLRPSKSLICRQRSKI